MTFENKYPQLYILFGASLFIGSVEDLDDEAVLEQYANDCNAVSLLNTKEEMADFMQNSVYWKGAANAAFRYFPDDASLSAWIHYINDFLKSNNFNIRL